TPFGCSSRVASTPPSSSPTGWGWTSCRPPSTPSGARTTRERCSSSHDQRSHRTMTLSGKVAVVTGGGSGLGRASAVALAAAGASVVVGDVNEAGADETVATIAKADGTARAVRLDVADPASCEAVMAGAAEAYGGLHVLHNSAGVAWPGRDG